MNLQTQLKLAVHAIENSNHPDRATLIKSAAEMAQDAMRYPELAGEFAARMTDAVLVVGLQYTYNLQTVFSGRTAVGQV